ncbi:hypothetical protein [Neobacillus mesonae]|uniref:hypothetical protein n=1 Tax=Neobacillus mesonae TaxID=1193713 RepID=UPI000A40C671|nr:hypothetical protein [Neobacillus mesonae]
MGLRCECDVSVYACPAFGILGEVNRVSFIVNVTGLCKNCTATCALSPADFGTCLLTSSDVTTPAETIPVGPGETYVTAEVTLRNCPITVTVTVTCIDDFGRITCTDSAECTIRICDG